MRARYAGLVGLVGAMAAIAGPEAVGQPAAPKPVWVYAHDLRVRKGGEKDFTPETPKVGVEFFKDEAGGASRSLRSDTQGKTFALALLQMPIEVPADHAAMRRGA